MTLSLQSSCLKTFCAHTLWIAGFSPPCMQLDMSSCTPGQWQESCCMKCLIRKTYATIRGLSSLIFTTPLHVRGPLSMPSILRLHLSSIRLGHSTADSARAARSQELVDTTTQGWDVFQICKPVVKYTASD